MKSFFLAAAASLALIAGAASAQAQDRGQRGPQSSYTNTPQRWDNNGPRNGNARSYNGNSRHYRHHRMSRYQQHRGHGAGANNWAYQQGVRDGRRQAHRRNCGNGRW